MPTHRSILCENAGLAQRAAKRRSQAAGSYLIPLSLVLLVSGCGGEMTAEELARTTEETRSGLRIARRAAVVLDFLHLLPSDSCGEPEQQLVSRIIPAIEQSLGCAVVTRTAEGPDDVTRVSFPDEGCTLRGRHVTGTLSFSFSTGEDRKDFTVDLNEVQFDGTALSARGGYGECGDSQRYWADLSGQLPYSEDRRYLVTGSFEQMSGLPIVGGDQASLDVTGIMTTPTGSHRLRISGLVMMLFKTPIPRRGELEIELEDGRHIHARVQNEDLSEELLNVEVQLDDKAPATLRTSL